MRGRPAAAFALIAVVAGCTATPPPQPRTFVVYFKIDDGTLTPEAQQIVANAAAASHDGPPSKIVVEGHADGGTTNDAALADRRAIAVIGTLVGDGVAATAIEKSQGAPATGVTGLAAHQVIIRLMP